MDIECPNPAYKRLLRAGLDGKIFDKRDVLMHLLLGMIDDKTDEMLKKAEKEWTANHGEKISERTRFYEDLMDFLEELDNEDPLTTHEEKEMRPVRHPSFLAYAVLGEDVLRFQEFGFPTRKSLEQAITSFCIGEQSVIKSWQNHYSWRQGDNKSWLSNGYHGDLWFGQADVSGEDRREPTLFGEVDVFDTIKDTSKLGKNIIADWTDWKIFLMASLRYAEVIGQKRMPEIVHWQEALERAGGGVGTATAEGMFGGIDSPWELENLMRSYLIEGKRDKKEYSHETFPLIISFRTGDSNILYVPYVSKDNLVYLKSVGQDEQGEITLPFDGRLGKIKFTPHITFTPEDLPELLAGTYRLFARDRSLMPKIIKAFLNGRTDNYYKFLDK